jgi:hypothetical protein
VPTSDVKSVLRFIREVELTRPLGAVRGGASNAPVVHELGAQEAAIVGSDVIGFDASIAPELREVVTNASLLAQLAAERQVKDRDNVTQWFDTYFDTLSRTGWIVEERTLSEHVETGHAVDVHQAVFELAKTLLAPSPASLDVVQATLDALKMMSEGGWTKIFRRESQTNKSGRFQVTTVVNQGSGLVIHKMAFELVAKTEFTQVLAFKRKTMDVTLRHQSGRLRLDTELALQIRGQLAERIASYTNDFIRQIPI